MSSGGNLSLKKTFIVVATAAGLAAILNNPGSGSMAQGVSEQAEIVRKIAEPLVIEQDLVQKIIEPLVIEENILEKMSPKKKHYSDLSQAFQNSDLVFKGKCIDVTIAYCEAVGDLCASYVFETELFYKHPAIGGSRKYILKDKISLFSDVRSLDDISRFERDMMNGGSNGGIYEPTGKSIIAGDSGIFMAKSNNGLYFIRYSVHGKKNSRLMDEILSEQAKK